MVKVRVDQGGHPDKAPVDQGDHQEKDLVGLGDHLVKALVDQEGPQAKDLDHQGILE